jgi:hypothetical protein
MRHDSDEACRSALEQNLPVPTVLPSQLADVLWDACHKLPPSLKRAADLADVEVGLFGNVFEEEDAEAAEKDAAATIDDAEQDAALAGQLVLVTAGVPGVDKRVQQLAAQAEQHVMEVKQKEMVHKKEEANEAVRRVEHKVGSSDLKKKLAAITEGEPVTKTRLVSDQECKDLAPSDCIRSDHCYWTSNRMDMRECRPLPIHAKDCTNAKMHWYNDKCYKKSDSTLKQHRSTQEIDDLQKQVQSCNAAPGDCNSELCDQTWGIISPEKCTPRQCGAIESQWCPDYCASAKNWRGADICVTKEKARQSMKSVAPCMDVGGIWTGEKCL